MATADAAKKPKLKISGYYEMFAGIADADRDGNTVDGTPTYQGDGFNEEGNFAIVHYGEIRFKASGKTDSGMKWGVYFEDVMDDADADGNNEKQSTDETNLWLSGSWGKLEIGGQDGPADKMYRGAEKLAHISPNMLDMYASTQTERGSRGFAREKMSIADTSDATKITYYTPRISGFLAGYSWIPENEAKGSVSGSLCDSRSEHEFAVEYKGKLGGGKLHATLGGSITAGDPAESTGEVDTSTFGWRTGVTYSQGPWTVAAGYKDAGDRRRFDQTGGETGWDVGASYSGGRWEVSLLHIHIDAEDDDGDIEWDHTMLTGAYNLGGGLTMSASINMFDLDNPDSGSDGGNDGWAIIVGMGAKF
jgi:predicted porin